MNCPVDDTPLQMSDRNGVEIDYCPRCRGVWLDRGELDKIIERASSPARGHAPVSSSRQDDNSSYSSHGQHDDDDDDDDRDSHHGGYDSHGRHSQHKRKKESFLGDLFDF